MEKTCGNCENIDGAKLLGNGISVWGCKATGLVIPHHTRMEEDKEVVTFWRVPTDCPRDDSEVLKSKDKAPEQDWVTHTL